MIWLKSSLCIIHVYYLLDWKNGKRFSTRYIFVKWDSLSQNLFLSIYKWKINPTLELNSNSDSNSCHEANDLKVGMEIMYSKVRNKRTGTFISFWDFFPPKLSFFRRGAFTKIWISWDFAMTLKDWGCTSIYLLLQYDNSRWF